MTRKTNHVKLLATLSCFVFLLIVRCGNKIIQNTDSNYTYTPLHVGDVRQLVSLADSFTIYISIQGKTNRKDAQEVYIEIIKYGLGNYQFSYDTSYYFIRDSFLVSTYLDTMKDSNGIYEDSSNLFLEFNMALEKPIDGYKWYWPSVQYRSFFKEDLIGKLSTFIGEIDDVYSVGNYWTMPIYKHKANLINYYGKNIGLVGVEAYDTLGTIQTNWKLSYAKIEQKEYGKLFPERDPFLAKIQKQSKCLTNASISTRGRLPRGCF